MGEWKNNLFLHSKLIFVGINHLQQYPLTFFVQVKESGWPGAAYFTIDAFVAQPFSMEIQKMGRPQITLEQELRLKIRVSGKGKAGQPTPALKG